MQQPALMKSPAGAAKEVLPLFLAGSTVPWRDLLLWERNGPSFSRAQVENFLRVVAKKDDPALLDAAWEAARTMLVAPTRLPAGHLQRLGEAIDILRDGASAKYRALGDRLYSILAAATASHWLMLRRATRRNGEACPMPQIAGDKRYPPEVLRGPEAHLSTVSLLIHAASLCLADRAAAAIPQALVVAAADGMVASLHADKDSGFTRAVAHLLERCEQDKATPQVLTEMARLALAADKEVLAWREPLREFAARNLVLVEAGEVVTSLPPATAYAEAAFGGDVVDSMLVGGIALAALASRDRDDEDVVELTYRSEWSHAAAGNMDDMPQEPADVPSLWRYLVRPARTFLGLVCDVWATSRRADMSEEARKYLARQRFMTATDTWFSTRQSCDGYVKVGCGRVYASPLGPWLGRDDLAHVWLVHGTDLRAAPVDAYAQTMQARRADVLANMDADRRERMDALLTRAARALEELVTADHQRLDSPFAGYVTLDDLQEVAARVLTDEVDGDKDAVEVSVAEDLLAALFSFLSGTPGGGCGRSASVYGVMEAQAYSDMVKRGAPEAPCLSPAEESGVVFVGWPGAEQAAAFLGYVESSTPEFSLMDKLARLRPKTADDLAEALREYAAAMRHVPMLAAWARAAGCPTALVAKSGKTGKDFTWAGEAVPASVRAVLMDYAADLAATRLFSRRLSEGQAQLGVKAMLFLAEVAEARVAGSRESSAKTGEKEDVQ